MERAILRKIDTAIKDGEVAQAELGRELYDAFRTFTSRGMTDIPFSIVSSPVPSSPETGLLPASKVVFTESEQSLLNHLTANSQRIVSPSELVEQGLVKEPANVYTAVSRLRKKIGATGEPQTILNIRGRGYQLRSLLPDEIT